MYLPKSSCRYLDDQRGVALVVALLLLMVFTTIGFLALLNSTSGIREASSYKSNKEAFYAAEGAIEYIKGDGYYFITNSTKSFPDPAHPTSAARDLSAAGTNASGTVTYITSGNPPPGYGFSAKDTRASYYSIEATGTAQDGTTSTQEEGVAKILPKL